LQPEQALLITGAAASGAFILSILTSHKKYAKYCAFASCALIILALAMRWYAMGRPPWAELYESAALLALFAGLATAALYRKGEPAPLCMALSGLTALLALFSAYLWEPNPVLSEALDSSWLLVHVPAVIASYGLFAVSAMASATYVYLLLKSRKSAPALARLDRIASISVYIGLALLIAGTVMGAIWAKAAWGAYWSWDPKETWALITIIIYAIYTGLRLRGMKGEDAAYISMLGFLSVIFTYIGVSYLIPGLHSYA
jgi:cytochrome c-type biogenesis protein CcsB